jgi:outer membrane receptor for ferrienterochelin and colicins
MLCFLPYVLLVLGSSSAFAQPATLRVEVRSGAKPLAGAEVAVHGMAHETDQHGVVTAQMPPGAVDIVVTKKGFVPATVSLQLQAGQAHALAVDLIPQPALEEHVTVSATRTDRRIDDVPMRVEVLAREEIEEKMLMTPGDIVMLLNEMGGMRVQATSPALGAASVRVQGMRGRYTRFLSDGLPLFGDVGGLGLLQIPPMDLEQVEVIKGVASALYGAGAMGGVVNLVSRRPPEQPIRELLVNRSTRGATDAVLFTARPLSARWRGSLLAGGHWQEQTDIDHDGWADLPHYARAVVRPRLFWDGGGGRTLFATVGATYEDRVGGTMPDGVPAVIGGEYREALKTLRLDGGAIGQMLLRDRHVLAVRVAVNRQRHDHRFGEMRERDRHVTTFGEIALRGAAGRHTWVIGTAIERDTYAPRDVPRFSYAFTIPGVFLQDDIDVAPWLSVSGSGRLDHHSEYGTFFSPRVSGLLRAAGWATRLSAGMGFFGPTFLTEETEAAGLTRLAVPRPLRAERGRSASLDVTRTAGPASITLTLFASRVQNPIDIERGTALVLANLPEPTTNSGVELIGTVRRAPLALTGTYTFVDARESDSGRRTAVALTPRHSAGVVGMLEAEDAGRLGIELYFTGGQRLEHNPFRAASRPYVIVGFLAERHFGHVRLFLNAENITNVRQTRWDPLLRRQRAADGRWTVDAWAPLEGRALNGGVRFVF